MGTIDHNDRLIIIFKDTVLGEKSNIFLVHSQAFNEGLIQILEKENTPWGLR